MFKQEWKEVKPFKSRWMRLLKNHFILRSKSRHESRTNVDRTIKTRIKIKKDPAEADQADPAATSFQTPSRGGASGRFEGCDVQVTTSDDKNSFVSPKK
jgi:hypothetical protein